MLARPVHDGLLHFRHMHGQFYVESRSSESMLNTESGEICYGKWMTRPSFQPGHIAFGWVGIKFFETSRTNVFSSCFVFSENFTCLCSPVSLANPGAPPNYVRAGLG